MVRCFVDAASAYGLGFGGDAGLVRCFGSVPSECGLGRTVFQSQGGRSLPRRRPECPPKKKHGTRDAIDVLLPLP